MYGRPNIVPDCGSAQIVRTHYIFGILSLFTSKTNGAEYRPVCTQLEGTFTAVQLISENKRIGHIEVQSPDAPFPQHLPLGESWDTSIQMTWSSGPAHISKCGQCLSNGHLHIVVDLCPALGYVFCGIPREWHFPGRLWGDMALDVGSSGWPVI